MAISIVCNSFTFVDRNGTHFIELDFSHHEQMIECELARNCKAVVTAYMPVNGAKKPPAVHFKGSGLIHPKGGWRGFKYKRVDGKRKRFLAAKWEIEFCLCCINNGQPKVHAFEVKHPDRPSDLYAIHFRMAPVIQRQR